MSNERTGLNGTDRLELSGPSPWLLRCRDRFTKAGGSRASFNGAVNNYVNQHAAPLQQQIAALTAERDSLKLALQSIGSTLRQEKGHERSHNPA